MVQKNENNAHDDEQKLLKTTIVSVRLPEKMVSEIDRRAEKEMRTRSNYIGKLIMDSWNRMHEVNYSSLRKNFKDCIVENIEN